MSRPLALVSLSVLLFSFAASAQVNTATVYGTVTDPSGATVANAQASLENTATGAKLSTQSNSTGEFSFPVVPAGTYRLEVSATGFRSEAREGLVLSAGQNVKLALALELGSVSNTITVQAEVPLVNAVNAEQQTTLNRRNITQLPIARLDWTQLLSLNTGAAPNGSGEVTMNGMAPSGVHYHSGRHERNGGPRVQHAQPALELQHHQDHQS